MHIYDILMSLIVANLFAAKTENFQFDVIWREKINFAIWTFWLWIVSLFGNEAICESGKSKVRYN